MTDAMILNTLIMEAIIIFNLATAPQVQNLSTSSNHLFELGNRYTSMTFSFNSRLFHF